MTRSLACAIAIAIALPSAALADAGARDVEAVMTEYVRLWNAGDSAAISSRIYRLRADNPMSTQAGLQAEFDRLKAQGYHHSVTHSVEGCHLTPTQAIAQLRFTRLKTDGQPMPPKERATLYVLRKFPEGWRITDLIGMSASARLSCASYSD
ncbi:nuclear transport factor 2 family protein [Phenylobacterium sp.]|jgi:ketosteroid isomerase-like protein|uniref:nuclear transport factor 2 family protein n=1 Tax=Phenylobacterium sp. TaxID=1871053 RepID=UPI002F93E4B4